MNLHFLHGFLGMPSDWDAFRDHFSPHQCTFHSIEKFLSFENPEKNSFQVWAQNFNHSIFLSNVSQSGRGTNILIGYSLGGRLALHSLLEGNFWKAAIIISAHPGLTDEMEKYERLKADKTWAHQFLTEPWEGVLGRWNAQSVFFGCQNNFVRDERFYNREILAKLLTEFSLGKQKDLRTELKNCSIPLLWISGQHDRKFTILGREMESLNPNIKSVVIEHAGHRVPWENSGHFLHACRKFMIGDTD